MRGGSRLNFLIILTILVVGGYVGYQLVPVYYRATMLQSYMQDMVNNAALAGKKPTWVEQQLHGQADYYGVPADAHIEATTRADRIEAHVSFTRPIPLIVTTYQYTFDYTAKSATLTTGG
jgi:hypothetical protein